MPRNRGTRNRGWRGTGSDRVSTQEHTPTISYIKAQRLAVVQRLLARGALDHEIIDGCQDHKAFKTSAGRVLARSTIRRKYLYEARRLLRSTTINVDDELQNSMERMRSAYRMAELQERPAVMARVQREMSRMLGLKRQAMARDPVDAGKIFAQLNAMRETVTGGPEVEGDDDERDEGEP